ncbi:MAG: hypothetical protein WDA11_01315 [Thiohalomonadaceae bacterium]
MPKFNHLAIGQRFRWNGEIWRKTSPLLAVHEVTGSSRLVPRAAVLQSVDDSTGAPAPTVPLDPQRVAAALTEHLDACLQALAAQPITPATKDALADAIRASDAALRSRLALS